MRADATRRAPRTNLRSVALVGVVIALACTLVGAEPFERLAAGATHMSFEPRVECAHTLGPMSKAAAPDILVVPMHGVTLAEAKRLESSLEATFGARTALLLDQTCRGCTPNADGLVPATALESMIVEGATNRDWLTHSRTLHVVVSNRRLHDPDGDVVLARRNLASRTITVSTSGLGEGELLLERLEKLMARHVGALGYGCASSEDPRSFMYAHTERAEDLDVMYPPALVP